MAQTTDLVELLDQFSDSESNNILNKPQRMRNHRTMSVQNGFKPNGLEMAEQNRSQNRGSMNVVEKRKLKIMIVIGSAHVAVTEPQDLYVQWTRHGKSIKTKKQTVDQTIVEPKFRDKFGMSSSFRFDGHTQTFLPDISEISLFCENQLVGTCAIDLVSYIDKQSKLEKVFIASSQAMHNPYDHKVLIGDHNKYPGAYMTFKISVQS